MIKEIPSISSSYQDGKTVQYSLQKCYKFFHYYVACKQPVVIISFTWAEVFSAQQQITKRDSLQGRFKSTA